MITFELETELTTDPPQFSLTCRSDGGPVTTVEWERDGVMIQDDNNHSSSQIVVDPLSVVYHNVLVVTGRNGGEYMCTVINDKTSLSGIINVEGTYIHGCMHPFSQFSTVIFQWEQILPI